MKPPGITVDIPGFGRREILVVVSDYTGTLSCRGLLTQGVRDHLLALTERVEFHVLTADTYNTAEPQLQGIGVTLDRLLNAKPQDVEKEDFVKRFDLTHVAVFGNGRNDRLAVKAVRETGGLAIAVDNGEGCAVETLQNAHLFIVGAVNALGLLTETKSLIASLRSAGDSKK